MKKASKAFSLVLLAAGLAGCGSVPKIDANVSKRMGDIKAQSVEVPMPVVTVVDRARPSGRAVEANDERQGVEIRVANANFYDLITKVSSQIGYGVFATSGIDLNRQISMSINAANPVQAIRHLAWQAGYVAIFNKQDRTVAIAREATMVFRVPSDDLKKMVSTKFKFGGTPVGGSGGGGSGGGATIAPVAADFVVTGDFTNSPQAFQLFLEEVAGQNARVQVYLEGGMISVRSNGQALKRVHDFLAHYAFDARRQVEVNARVVEVSLANDFRYGIQWDKVIDAAHPTRSIKLGLNGTSVLDRANPSAATLSFGSTSVNSIIEALETLTSVQVTSTPQITVSNNSSGVIFEGIQKPYMPSVTATVTGSGPTASVQKTGTGAYASDGIQMSIHANILDDENAVLTIVPSTVSLGNLQKFLDDQVQMYEQSVRSGGQRISIRSGETVVISGNRYTRGNSIDKSLPGLINVPVVGAATGGASKDSVSRQTVIIMNARVIRPAPTDIVFSESI
jgi:type II secretory pathway component GspD/PulD (secretin)